MRHDFGLIMNEIIESKYCYFIKTKDNHKILELKGLQLFVLTHEEFDEIQEILKKQYVIERTEYAAYTYIKLADKKTEMLIPEYEPKIRGNKDLSLEQKIMLHVTSSRVDIAQQEILKIIKELCEKQKELCNHQFQVFRPEKVFNQEDIQKLIKLTPLACEIKK